MVTLIGISGKMYSGKDTVAAMIREVLPEFEIVRFAGKLKIMAEMMTGIPAEDFNKPEVKQRHLGPDWDMTARELLQRLGTNAVRDGLHLNAWVNALFAGYDDQLWIVPDTRFPNEFEAIKKRNGIMLRIERSGLESNDHPSETALDDFQCDYVIENNSTLEDLRAKVYEVLTMISETMEVE